VMDGRAARARARRSRSRCAAPRAPHAHEPAPGRVRAPRRLLALPPRVRQHGDPRRDRRRCSRW
jgi:hypothetical protein